MYTKIDLEKYPRRSTYNYYKSFEDPFFNISSNLDVTAILQYCKTKGIKFSQASMYCSLKTINDLAPFRLRIVNEELRCYHTIHGGSTVLRPDLTFSFCYFNYQEDPRLFMQEMAQQVELAKNGTDFDPADDRFDLIHYSSLPWISFTHMKHARRIPVTDSIPKLVFGKYFNQGQQYWLPFSVSSHHALIDGYFVGEYFNTFQKNLNEFSI